jgi:hypothetical protein
LADSAIVVWRFRHFRAALGWELINVALNRTLAHEDGGRWNTHKAVLRRLSARGGLRS